MASVIGNFVKSIGNITSSFAYAPSVIVQGLSQHFILRSNTNAQAWTPLVTAVRHRYFAERRAAGPTLRNYGYKDRLHTTGLMPHMEHKERLPIPLYRPKNSWAPKRGLRGQNDYIDILGDGSLHPAQVLYSTPAWLRGFKGNEFQMLLRKRKLFGKEMRDKRPTKYKQMNMRIKWLYRFLNQKTRDYYWHRT
ncbi:large ribosomal subunit protein mL51-like isoform X2 [Macrobrachium nipponense]